MNLRVDAQVEYKGHRCTVRKIDPYGYCLLEDEDGETYNPHQSCSEINRANWFIWACEDAIRNEGSVARYYGVKCKACEETITLGECEPSARNTVTFYAPPLDAVSCKACGSSYQYSSDDVFEFAA
jgi:ribosomal protein S27E